MGTSTSTTGTGRARTGRSGLAALVAGTAILVGSATLDGLSILMLIGFPGLVHGTTGGHGRHAPADGWPGRCGALLIRSRGAVTVLSGIGFLGWEAVGDPPEQEPSVPERAWTNGSAASVVGRTGLPGRRARPWPG